MGQHAQAFLFLTVLLLTLCSVPSCFGDPGILQKVLIHNATDITVTVWGGANSDYIDKKPDGLLQPGETQEDYWFIPPKTTKRRTVQAYDEAGNLIYCKTYTHTYEDARRTVLTIEVTKNDISCD